MNNPTNLGPLTPITLMEVFSKIATIHKITVQNLKTDVETFKMRRKSYTSNIGFC